MLRKIFSAALLVLLPLGARADLSPVRIRVEQQNSVDDARHKTTQTKALKIFLSNSVRQDFPGLKLKYFYFARDVKSRNVKVAARGERPADLKAMATAVVETPAATAKSVEEHSEGGNFGQTRRRNERVKYGKKVPASGEKFIGYGVQVLDASGKVLAEAFDPPSLKQEAPAR